MKKSFFLILSFYFLISFSQNCNQHIDSILSIVKKSKNIEQKIYQYLKIEINCRNKNFDTALYYSKLALKLSEKINNDSLKNKAYNSIGIDYKLIGKYDSAEIFLEKSLQISLSENDSADISSSYNNLGILYYDKGDYNKALENFIKSVKISENIKDNIGIALSYNNIGMIHYYLNDYDRALQYYEKAMKIKEKLKDYDGTALLKMNIGIIYYYKEDYEMVLKYFNQAQKIWEQSGNKRRLALIKSNIGELYLDLGLYPESIKYLKEAIKLYSELNEVFDVIQTELLLGQVYVENKDYKSALEFYNSALKKARKSNSLSEQLAVYEQYQELYAKMGNYKKAYKYQDKYYNIKDSIFNKEKSDKIEELETKYQTEKKEKQIELMKKDKLLSELKEKKLLNTIYSILIVSVLLIMLIFYVLRAYKIKKQAYEKIKRQKEEIAQKNAELNQRNEEILAQRDEIEQQRDIANEQRDLILKQKEAITNSIEYALRIQQAIIPREKEIKNILQDYFIFYLPKDVVSGDFYFVKKINEYTIVSVVDCTGHGVPGAFMSMLGVAFLNEITKKEDIKSPAQVLNNLREYIIESLKQQGEYAEQLDGMDMSLVVFQENSNIIEYAGANNPIYIITEKEIKIKTKFTKIKIFKTKEISKRLYEIIPNKMPISMYPKMNSFKNHIIEIPKNSQIVLFSDGFADQFGGLKRKKYRYINFKKLLLLNSNKEMNIQKIEIVKEFENWKANCEQIDDVTILSFKFY